MKKIVIEGFFWMFLAGLLVNVMQFVIKIFLAKILMPEDFGIMAIAISIIGFTSFLQDLGLGTALIQRKNNVQESFNCVFFFVLLSSITLALSLFLISSPLSQFFNDSRLKIILQSIVITLPLGASGIPYFAYLSKNLLFFKKFLVETAPVAFGSLSSLILAMFGWGYLSLVIGYVIGATTYALLLFILTPWTPVFVFDWQVFKELVHYGKYIFLVQLLAVFLGQGDNFIIGKILGTSQVGYYAIAYTLAVLPALNIAHTISKVLFPVFAKLQDETESLKKSFIKSITIISASVFPIAFGTILITPFLFSVVLGAKWLPAKFPLIILSFLAIFKSFNVLPSFFLEATGDSKSDTKITFKAFLIMSLLVIPATYKFGIVGTGIIMSLSFLYATSLYFVKCANKLSISILEVIRNSFASFFSAIVMTLIGMLTIHLLHYVYTLSNLFLVIAICAFFYLILLFLLDKKLFLEFKILFLDFFNRQQ